MDLLTGLRPDHNHRGKIFGRFHVEGTRPTHIRMLSVSKFGTLTHRRSNNACANRCADFGPPLELKAYMAGDCLDRMDCLEERLSLFW